MKYLIFLVLIISACNFSKVSNVRIENNNNYAIDVTLHALNVSYEAKNIAPNSKKNGLLDFTKIDKTNGEYLLVIKHLNDGSVDSFLHGEIMGGALSNYTDIQVNGHEARVQISE